MQNKNGAVKFTFISMIYFHNGFVTLIKLRFLSKRKQFPNSHKRNENLKIRLPLITNE